MACFVVGGGEAVAVTAVRSIVKKKEMERGIVDKDGNQLCLIDIIADGEDVADKIELSIRSEQLYRYIESSLDERERQIVTLRYGLFGQPQLPQREVAKRLGISRSYVSRIEKKALKLLKDRFDKQ